MRVKHKLFYLFFFAYNMYNDQNCLLVIRPRTIIRQDLWLGELIPSPHDAAHFLEFVYLFS